LGKKHREDQAKNMRYLLIRIQNEAGADQGKSNIQNMKQNIELMNQFLKNMMSLRQDDMKHKLFGQPYFSLELIGEEELIKFVIGCPKDYLGYLEQSIGSFFPGCSVDHISMPKLLVEGKYATWGDIVYSKPFQLPVKTYEQFEADPMDSILSSFSKISYDETLAIQLIISPIDESFIRQQRQWLDEIKKGKKKGKGILGGVLGIFGEIFTNLSWGKPKEENKETPKEEKSHYNNQQSSDIDKKFDDELFEVGIKIFASSPSYDRANQVTQDMVRLFGQYSYSGLNSYKFKPLWQLQTFARSLVNRSLKNNISWFKTLSKPKGTLMSIKELSSLYHLPNSKFNKNPRIRWQNFKIVPAPDHLPSEGLLIGYNSYAGAHKEIRITDTDRFRHFYVLDKQERVKLLLYWWWQKTISSMVKDSLLLIPMEIFVSICWIISRKKELMIWFISTLPTSKIHLLSMYSRQKLLKKEMWWFQIWLICS
jgi:hypothetical protein